MSLDIKQETNDRLEKNLQCVIHIEMKIHNVSSHDLLRGLHVYCKWGVKDHDRGEHEGHNREEPVGQIGEPSRSSVADSNTVFQMVNKDISSREAKRERLCFHVSTRRMS